MPMFGWICGMCKNCKTEPQNIQIFAASFTALSSALGLRLWVYKADPREICPKLDHAAWKTWFTECS